jgi:dTMP kinase
MPPATGRFITLEGIDGAGKSTHAAFIAARINAQGRKVVATREPGGTTLGEKLRLLLLNESMTRDTEALLMFAARREHLELVIRPALNRGDWVVCDRFTDATYAYQGGGHGVPFARIGELERWVHEDCQPDVTFLFDVPTEVSRARLDSAELAGRALDKFEREANAFFTRVRDAYLERAAALPERFRIIDSTRPVEVVRAELAAHLKALGLPE